MGEQHASCSLCVQTVLVMLNDCADDEQEA
jgi:hypothetical protein